MLTSIRKILPVANYLLLIQDCDILVRALDIILDHLKEIAEVTGDGRPAAQHLLDGADSWADVVKHAVQV